MLFLSWPFLFTQKERAFLQNEARVRSTKSRERKQAKRQKQKQNCSALGAEQLPLKATPILRFLVIGYGCSGLVHWEDPEGWDGEGGRRGDRDGEHM